MKLIAILFVVLLFSPSAYSVNRCTDSGGKISYQQAPCTIYGGGEKIKIQTPGMSPETAMDIRVSGQIIRTQPATKAEITYCMALVLGPMYDPKTAIFDDRYIPEMGFYSDGYALLRVKFDIAANDGRWLGSNIYRCVFDVSGKIALHD